MMGYRWSVALIHLKLIAFALLLLCTGSDGDRKSGSSSSVFSLFNLKQKSRFWSESVIRAGEFKDLQSSSPGRMASRNFSEAGNVANYLNLLEVDAMYLPVPVNFIFIGFDGKGNHEFKLHPEELERWFTKIDHIFEHSRVPQLGEVFTPLSKITTEKAQTHHLPFVSRINYNYSVHAIQMGEKVSSVFERAINILARREDLYDNRTEETVLWQVDVDTVEVLFSSLVEYLQLENAYNIFILNPKHNPRIAKYGYRRGLSVSEINILKQNKSLQTRILKSGGLPGSILALDKIKRPLYEKHPMAKFAWTVTEDTDTVEWHNVLPRCT